AADPGDHRRALPGGGRRMNRTTRQPRPSLSVLLRPEYALPLVTLVFVIFLSFASDVFLSERNLLNITSAVALVGIAAAFATMVVISGGIDLSPVVVFIITGMVCKALLDNGWPIVPTVVVGVL